MIKANKSKMSASKSASEVTSFGLTTIALSAMLVLLVLSFCSSPTQARYLPTRADEADVEVLKALIKELLVQASLEQQLESRMNQLQAANPAANSVGHLIYQRRSAEVPQFAGVSDNAQRSLSSQVE